MALIEEKRVQEYFPTEWQEEDLSALLSDERKLANGANWSEMGTYKTTTGLWLAERYAKKHGIENPNVLIITTRSGKGTYRDAVPKSLDDRWRMFNVGTREATVFAQFGLEFKYDMDYLKAVLKAKTKPTIVLAHYHVFMNKSPMRFLLNTIDWDVIICDEAHRMKNRKTQWTRNIKYLRCEGLRHVMTGTGFINDPSEMWSPLNFLSREIFGSYWKFRERYCLEEDFSGFRKVVGINPEYVDEFRELRKILGPRRMMAEVHSQIKEPIFTPVEVDLNSIQRKMYNEIKRDLMTLDQKGTPIYSPNVLSQLNRLRQVCVATPEKVREYYDPKLERTVQEIRLIEPSSKLDALMEIIEGLEWDEENKQQLVVFSNFKDPLELAKVRFENAGISYIHMEAKDSDKVRYEKWHDLLQRKSHQVFLSTLQLGAESINLSSAQHAVFLDRSWSPKDNNQGVSRLYRPGQEGLAHIIHINAVKTTDQRVEAMHNLKTGWFKTIFADED